mgnify:CR=1 FL=1
MTHEPEPKNPSEGAVGTGGGDDAAAVAASGLLVLSIYYMMQGFTGTKKLVGLVFGLGLMQVGTPLAQSLAPLLYGDGDLNGVFAFQATLALACTACLFALPLPPGITVRKSFTLTDALSFTLFASGIALLCAFLVQGRTVWWTTQWLGWLLAGGVGLTGLALYIESTRHKPMLDWHWMTVPQILIFAVMGAMARLLTSEQTVGAAGGMGSAQMSTFYLIVAGGMLAGVVGSLILLDINDIRRPVMVALACFALGAWLEIGVGMQTRPAQLYFSQSIVAFATLLFMGPMMLEGALRALAKSPDHMMSFSAVFGLSQTLGGLAGAAAFSAFLTYRTRDHLAAMLTRSGANIDDVVSGVHRVLIMLHNDQCVAEVAQMAQRRKETVVVALMEADARLIEDVEHAHEPRADLRRQPYALRLARAYPPRVRASNSRDQHRGGNADARESPSESPQQSSPRAG